MAPLFVDTNIIIEAVRTRCWNALAGHYQVETARTCYNEAVAGDRLRPGYVVVDQEQLGMKLTAVHEVSDVQRAALAVRSPESDGLDDGERDLFAHLIGRTDEFLLSCADRAAVKIACALGWKDRIHSLEKMAEAAGARPRLKSHFTEGWLSEVRTRFLLG